MLLCMCSFRGRRRNIFRIGVDLTPSSQGEASPPGRTPASPVAVSPRTPRGGAWPASRAASLRASAKCSRPCVPDSASAVICFATSGRKVTREEGTGDRHGAFGCKKGKNQGLGSSRIGRRGSMSAPEPRFSQVEENRLETAPGS